MRHKKNRRKLGVVTKHRKAMFRNMATDFFKHESLKTTDIRAKEIRRVLEKLITLAKDGSLAARRKASTQIRDRAVLSKLFGEIAEKFKNRPGGYTRIIKLGYRKGDNTPISLIELVKEEYKPKSKKKKKTKKTAKKTVKADTGKETKTKSTKRESAEELGLIEDAAKTTAPPEDVVVETKEDLEESKAAPEGKESETETKKEKNVAERAEVSEQNKIKEDQSGGTEKSDEDSIEEDESPEAKADKTKQPDNVDSLKDKQEDSFSDKDDSEGKS